MNPGDGHTARHLRVLLDGDDAELYDRAPCGLLSMTPDGTIIRCNQAFRDLVGRPHESLVGSIRFAELLTRGGQIYFETHYAPLLRMHGAASEIALEVLRPDGSRVPVLVNATLDADAEGRPTVTRAAVFQARHRRDYERELLEKSQKLAASEQRARSLATTLQQTLLPPSTPVVPGLDVGACYRPAADGSEVGGDFYDLFQVHDTSWVVVLGDVCGKGAEAAVLTALSRYALRAAAMQSPSPAHALRVLNDILAAEGRDRHATVACLRLDQHPHGWRLRSAFAGHPLALHRQADGDVHELGVPGEAVGLFPTIEVTDTDTDLLPGAAVLLHTDGIPEARRGRSFFGDARLAELLSQPLTTAQDRIDEILDDVMTFQSHTASDDIAAVLLHAPRGA